MKQMIHVLLKGNAFIKKWKTKQNRARLRQQTKTKKTNAKSNYNCVPNKTNFHGFNDPYSPVELHFPAPI